MTTYNLTLHDNVSPPLIKIYFYIVDFTEGGYMVICHATQRSAAVYQRCGYESRWRKYIIFIKQYLSLLHLLQHWYMILHLVHMKQWNSIRSLPMSVIPIILEMDSLLLLWMVYAWFLLQYVVNKVTVYILK